MFTQQSSTLKLTDFTSKLQRASALIWREEKKHGGAGKGIEWADRPGLNKRACTAPGVCAWGQNDEYASSKV